MRSLVWAATGLLILIWSGAAWLVHAAIGLGGGLAATNADLLPGGPELVEWVSWLAIFGTGAGEWLVVAVWGLVTVILLALGFLATRLLPRLAHFSTPKNSRTS